KWWISGRFSSTQSDVVKVSSQRRQTEIQPTNLRSSPGRQVCLLDDLSQRVVTKVAAAQVEVSANGCNEKQGQTSYEKPAYRSFPLHALPLHEELLKSLTDRYVILVRAQSWDWI